MTSGKRGGAPHGRAPRPRPAAVSAIPTGGRREHVKLLVLTPEPISPEMLRAAAGDGVDDAEVMVVTPATGSSGLRFWMNDVDGDIAHAREAADETVERLEEEGVDAAGDTGEAEPALALQDALATFPADRIVVFTHPGGDRDYREDEGMQDAEARFGVPVIFSEISKEL